MSDKVYENSMGGSETGRYVFLCDGSLEGILSAVHRAYYSRYGHKNISIQICGNYEASLFCEYIQAETAYERAELVAGAIRKKIGIRAWDMVFKAAHSEDGDRAMAIYRFLNYGFVMGSRVCGYLSDPYVHRVFELARTVERECHRHLQFIRFKELEGGILAAMIEPKSHILYMIGEHFADRFPWENWVIYDMSHKDACIHRAGGPWVVEKGVELHLDRLEDLSRTEQDFEDLWRTFFRHIEIDARKNPRCQMNMMPKYFWKDMTEMQPNKKDFRL